jgi:3-oxoacyl-[acyl-carrier-protein] synthase II
MIPRRVVVTGLGLVTPFGRNRDDSWQGLLSGQSAIGWLDFDASGQPQRTEHPPRLQTFGALVPEITTGPGRQIAFARTAAAEAIEQARLTRPLLRETACVFGTSKIDMQQFDRWSQALGETEPCAPIDPWTILSAGSIARHLAAEFECQAGILSPVAACATGLASLIRAAELIRCGDCSVVLAGSSDAALHPGLLASYRRLGVLARPGTQPEQCCRPFDRQRQGFAVGEGAAALVLEDREHAQRRGAPLLAEWIDGGLASDPSGLTLIDPAGTALAECVRRLLRRNDLSPESIAAVSLHGTATRLNDQAENAALRTALALTQRRLPGFGLKGGIGHLMGAAGAVEIAAAILALQQGVLPPTVSHQQAEEDCALEFSSTPRPGPWDRMLKVSLGFGGHVAAAVLERIQS